MADRNKEDRKKGHLNSYHQFSNGAMKGSKAHAVKQSCMGSPRFRCFGPEGPKASAQGASPPCYTYLSEWAALAGARAFQPAAGRSHAASGGSSSGSSDLRGFGEGRLPTEAGWWGESGVLRAGKPARHRRFAGLAKLMCHNEVVRPPAIHGEPLRGSWAKLQRTTPWFNHASFIRAEASQQPS